MVALQRTRIGGLQLDAEQLPRAEWRVATPADLEALFNGDQSSMPAADHTQVLRHAPGISGPETLNTLKP